jgi:ribosomal protein L21E
MAIGEVIKTEEHGGKPSLTIKWDDKPQGWGYKSMNDYGQVRHDLSQFHVGDMVDFEIEIMNFKGQSYERIGSIKKVSDEQDTSFNHGANVENRPDVERVISSEPIVSDTYDMDTYLKAVDTAYTQSKKHPNLKNLNEENLRAVCIGAAIQHMRSNGR